MNLVSIKIWNFLSVGQVERDLANQGLVILIGENLDDPSTDSNGAGKSSLPEAIVWGLYGTTIRGIKTDAVVNRRIGKDCRVELDLTVVEGRVQVRRCRKDSQATDAKGNKEPNQFRVWLNNEDVSSNDPKETQRTLVRLIGMDLDQFVRLVVIGQGFENRFTSMSDRALKEFIEARTKSIHYARACELAEAEESATAGQRNGLDDSRNVLQQGLADVRRRLDAERVEAEAQKKARDAEVERLQGTAQEMRKLSDQWDVELKRLQSEKEMKLVSVKETSDALALERQETRTRHDQENEEANAERQQLSETHRQSLETRQQERVEIGAGYDQRATALQTQRKQQEAFTTTTPIPPLPEEGSSVIHFQVEQINAVIGKLRNNEPCHECGQPLSPEVRGERLAQSEAKVEDLLKRLTAAQAQEQAVEQATAAIEVERAGNDEVVRGIDASIHAVWAEKGTKLEEFDAQTKTLQDQNMQSGAAIEAKYAPLRDRHNQELGALDAKSAAHDTEADGALRHFDAQIQNANNELASASGIAIGTENEIKTLQAKDLDSAVRDLEGQTGQSQSQIDELTEAITKLDDRLYCLKYLTTAFGLGGIRSFMLDNVLAYLNERLREHCQYLFDGRTQVALSPIKEKKKGGLSQKITLEVHTDGGSYDASSGGERRKVDVAVFLAFRDLNRMLTPVQINLEAYDEILSFLDGESASRVISLLLEDHTVDTKILITHRTDIPIVGEHKTWKAQKQMGLTTYLDVA